MLVIPRSFFFFFYNQVIIPILDSLLQNKATFLTKLNTKRKNKKGARGKEASPKESQRKGNKKDAQKQSQIERKE